MTAYALLTRAIEEEVAFPELVVFGELASPAEFRAIRLLSVSLGLLPDEVGPLVSRVWPDMELNESLGYELTRWPFVQQTVSGLEVKPNYVAAFAQSFRENDVAGFFRAHEQLATREAAQESSDEYETWLIRGRTAYYLAGVDSWKSVEAFGSTFEEAPVLRRSVARNWLTSLVIHQEYLLSEHARELNFFKGFRAYVSGHRAQALRHFEAVLREEAEDVFQAIALHLTGVIVRSRNANRSVDLLRKSIELSDALGLSDNAVMARHSLVWSIVDRSRRATGGEPTIDAAKEAARLARETLDLVHTRNKPALYAWVMRTAATTAWEVAVLESRDTVSAAQQAEAELSKAIDSALLVNDFDTAALALNEIAKIRRHQRNYEGSIETLEEATEFVEKWVIEPSAPRRLRQTAGSLHTMVDDPDLQDRLSLTAGRLDRLLLQIGASPN